MAKDPIEVWMIFQVVAATEDAAVDSLEEHVEKLETENGVESMTIEMDDVQEVDQPTPEVEKGYSRVCEVEMDVSGFDDLVNIVVNYGPTSVDVKGPESRQMDVGEMRTALNNVAQMMHQFLQAGAGGMMISRNREQ